MRQEGDVTSARALWEQGPSNNLRALIRNRFEWMNAYIDAERGVGIEIGCGTGVSKEFIRAKSFALTDYTDQPWVDCKMVDALNTPFDSSSFDFVVSSNMIHHVANPMRLFEEMHRILKPGGFLLVQEINCSFLMRCVLRLMRHEGYSYRVDVFDRDVICTDPDDLWSANVASPNLLFDDPGAFHRHLRGFTLLRSSFSEVFMFLNSGGVVAKTAYVPLPARFIPVLEMIDQGIASHFPHLFALQRQVVLRKD
jgi:SAM-dependent methyltransferase